MTVAFLCDGCGRREPPGPGGGLPAGWRILPVPGAGPEPERATLCSALCLVTWGERARQRARVLLGGSGETS
jgi:hypothetical protein